MSVRIPPCAVSLNIVTKVFPSVYSVLFLVVTHCITPGIKKRGIWLANRTIKYLQAILHHKPIVAFDWIQAIANVLDDTLVEKKNRSQSLACTIDFSISEFPPWKQYAIKGDLQVKPRCFTGPSLSLRSSNVGYYETC